MSNKAHFGEMNDQDRFTDPGNYYGFFWVGSKRFARWLAVFFNRHPRLGNLYAWVLEVFR